MSNAQDLLSILNASRAANPRPAAGATTSGSTEKSILNFKAGKMTTTLQSNGKYLVEPDKRRGELHVVYVSGVAGGASGGRVKLEWKDRRTKTVVNTIEVLPNVDATFERVLTGKDDDRVYLLQIGDNTSAEGRHFFWMQDKNTEPDEELCVKVNLYLSDVASAATEAGTSTSSADGAAAAAQPADGMDNAELLRIMQGALGSGGAEGASMVTVPGSNTIPTAGAGQIDALGNILESLGMPQNGSGVPSGETDAGRSDTAGLASSAPAAGGLTLSDLQGAMAGLATASPPGAAAAASAGPPLSELASADIIDESGILDDKDVVERLTKLLPEGQQTEAMLRENIRSPQVAQSLQRLTAALADDAGSFNSIIANFQLDPADGMSSMAAGNPIEAFLNCLLKDVEKKEGVKKTKLSDDKEEEDGGEKKNDDDKEGGSGEETKMDES